MNNRHSEHTQLPAFVIPAKAGIQNRRAQNFCTFILLIGLFFPARLCRADEALDLAKAFLKSGNRFEAVTECKRFICFNEDDSRVSDAYLLMGEAYRALQEWDQALASVSRSIALTANDSLKAERKVELGITKIAKGDYSGAEYELLRLTAFDPRRTVKRKASLFLGICRTQRYDWSGAREAFRASILGSDGHLPGILDSLLDARNCPSLKSEGTARLLSVIVPGSGQIYSGNILSGVNALGINSAFGYLFVRSVLDRRYDDAAIGYFSLLLRYYGGNIYHAATGAAEQNARVNRRHADLVLARVRDAVNDAEASPKRPTP